MRNVREARSFSRVSIRHFRRKTIGIGGMESHVLYTVLVSAGAMCWFIFGKIKPG